ncbi:MAG TPA: carbon-nitrogen hydrolase family protein [Verrucomicrobiae bacterium]
MKVALAQILVEPGEKQANLARAESWIAQAASRGAEIVVLPEAMPLGWTHPSARTLADEIPNGESCARLRAAARQHGIFVCAGVLERAGEKIFNAAVFAEPSGEIILHHRKIHELDLAHDLYARGDRLAVAETPFGRIGLMICADGFAPGQSISRALGMMGARVILSPCAWAVPHDHDNGREPYGQLWLDNYCPVAREFGLSIVGVSNVGPITAGPWQGRKCIGNSLVIGRDGRELARGPYGEHTEALLIQEL